MNYGPIDELVNQISMFLTSVSTFMTKSLPALVLILVGVVLLTIVYYLAVAAHAAIRPKNKDD